MSIFKNSFIKLIFRVTLFFIFNYVTVAYANQTEIKAEATESMTNPSKEYSVFFNLKQGKFIFATTKVDVEFNSVLLQRTSYFSNSNEWFYNLSFDYMYNKSKVSCYSLLASLGHKFYLFNTDSLSIKPSVGYGVTLYREQSNIQNVNTIGNNLFSQASVDYKLDSSKSISLNAQYNYQIHSRSMTAQNNADEMILEYLTYGLGLTWRF